MHTVPPGSHILVTGANGFIAIWIIRKLLEQGYSVRGAARSEAKLKHLKEYFKAYADKAEWVVVPDITEEGAFDHAVRGVDGIIHTASPLSSKSGDPDDYIIPAVQGTLSILRSALKEGGKIKRIVITSSVAAIVGSIPHPPRTFTEKDWAHESVEAVKTKGKDASDAEKYRASKMLAEQAAWDLHKRHRHDISWDLVALHPSYVVGPTLLEAHKPKDLSGSLGAWFNNLFLDKPEDALKGTYGYVHVEDIALAHVLSLQKRDAGGQRIIISSDSTTWQGTRNVAQKLYPEAYSGGVLPTGNTEATGEVIFYWDNAKAKSVLGLQFKSLEDIIRDTLDDFKSRGWMEKKYEPEDVAKKAA